MPDSPKITQNEQTAADTKKSICDFCTERVALIYCRADNAKLCIPCDREVHSTNQLFTKHTRFQLCDACSSAPATILCFTERTVVCQNCDYDLHNHRNSSAGGGSQFSHDRRPLEGFTGCPSVFELSSFLGFEDFDCKDVVLSERNDDDKQLGFGGVGGGLFERDGNDDDDGFCDLLVWDTSDAVVNLDDLIASTDKSHNFHAMGVPPLPKDRNLTCGQHKQDIMRQLCELAKLEPAIKQDSAPIVNQHFFHDDDQQDFKLQYNLQGYEHDEEHPVIRGNEVRTQTWGNDASETVNDIFISSSFSESHNEDSILLSDTQSGICNSLNLATNGCNSQFPGGTETLGFSPKVSTHEFTAVDRDSALSRYKEKKRTRRFEKHIRYESRKLQAENRIRIKGRFAKIDSRVNQV